LIFDNKRSELEIIEQILSLATHDTKKTRLMYQTNLCYHHFVEYMDFLIKKDLLGVKKGNPSGNVYYTTDEGKKFLIDVKNVLCHLK